MIDGEESYDFDEVMDEIARETEKKAAADVAAVHAEGGEPARVDDQVDVGCRIFSFTLRHPLPDHVEIRLWFEDEREELVEVWGRGWPWSGASVHAGDLLNALAAAFPVAGGEHCTLDSSMAVGVVKVGGLAELAFERDGEEVFVSAKGHRRAYGREHVIVAQTLMGLGDLLSVKLGPAHPASLAWRPVREATDLPPPEVEGEGPGAGDRLDAQADWFAARLGVEPGDYRRTAVDVHARQLLHGVFGHPEPLAFEHEPAHVADGPDDVTLRERVAKAASSMSSVGVDLTPKGLVRDAVATRNINAYQAVFYRDLDGPGSSP